VRTNGKGGSGSAALGVDDVNVIRPISYEQGSDEHVDKSRRTDMGAVDKVQGSLGNVFQSRAKSTALKVYTDGSSLGNGRNGASAGVGVFFGVDDPRNISEPLPGPRQTNQRAELTAILRALQTIPKTQAVQIITDSQYSIKCLTEWYPGWERNGWKNSKKEDVENQDLVKEILVLIRERSRLGTGGATDFLWVRGHDGDRGNEEADRLAVGGAGRGRV